MLILGIDTAAAPCCAAVYDTEKGQILGSTVINNNVIGVLWISHWLNKNDDTN